MTYVKSPIFYMGNKFKLLDQLVPLFPTNISVFYDVFGGSGVVGANVNAKYVTYNEINKNIVELYKLFLKYASDDIDYAIKKYIQTYDLNREGTNVMENNPDVKEVRDFYNKNYLNFRDTYNKTDKNDRNYLMLYTLTFYSFNNLIRFNNKSEFNMPYGNRCYTTKHHQQIKDWCDLLKTKTIQISDEDVFDVLQDTIFDNNDFIYLDPPYTNTLAIYNEKRAFGGWTVESDYRLFTILEKLDKCGIKWGMSNVFKNKKAINQHLIDWCNKNDWNVYHLNKNYSALGKGNANSDEVYICNYSQNNLDDLD